MAGLHLGAPMIMIDLALLAGGNFQSEDDEKLRVSKPMTLTQPF